MWIDSCAKRFFEIPEAGIIDIFVLVKVKNKLEIVIHDIVFNLVYCWQIYICTRIYLLGNCL